MDYALISKALANPTRLQIMALLKNPADNFLAQDYPVDMGIPAARFVRFGLSQSTTSAHLSTLKEAGLVSTRRVGQSVLFRRNEEIIGKYLEFLRETLGPVASTCL